MKKKAKKTNSKTKSQINTGVLVLENKKVFKGIGIGYQGEATGEVCFNTSLTGYQEIISDPSYAGQIINFTFPHIGNVVIQDNVEIGANNTVVRATLGSTLIEENTKTDDHVHIAHNCIVGRNCMITASAELSGSVRVGHDAWIGPNSSIMNKISLGNYSMIGLGSVVTKDIPDFSVFAGSPAKQLGWISINRGKLDLPIESEEILSFSSEGKVYVLDKNKLSIK